ncbi:MAG: hypothetical protein ABIQ77_07875 [Anaerolineales bacterium]
MKTNSAQVNSLNPYRQPSLADEIRMIDMKWIWTAALVVVLVVLGVFDPLEALVYATENEGVGEEGASVLGMVTGFTFPMTLGLSVIMFAFISGKGLPERPEAKLVAAAGVLFVSGLIGSALGWGLQPVYGSAISAPFWISFPLLVAAAYLTSYGFTLSICAFVVGTAIALQIERLLYTISE